MLSGLGRAIVPQIPVSAVVDVLSNLAIVLAEMQPNCTLLDTPATADFYLGSCIDFRRVPSIAATIAAAIALATITANTNC
ncbi:hypothetical protein [Microcoleus sp. herbarium14]|uniref:hypothetical protein n=1 Tax=Microcoleus sp. herbarium14 TaxID=3055439 RepID=UPI002FD4CD7B